MKICSVSTKSTQYYLSVVMSLLRHFPKLSRDFVATTEIMEVMIDGVTSC